MIGVLHEDVKELPSPLPPPASDSHFVFLHFFSMGVTYMQVKKQQLKLDMEQQTVSKLGKEYIKAVYCHPAFLTYMQGTS